MKYLILAEFRDTSSYNGNVQYLQNVITDLPPERWLLGMLKVCKGNHPNGIFTRVTLVNWLPIDDSVFTEMKELLVTVYDPSEILRACDGETIRQCNLPGPELSALGIFKKAVFGEGAFHP